LSFADMNAFGCTMRQGSSCASGQPPLIFRVTHLGESGRAAKGSRRRAHDPSGPRPAPASHSGPFKLWPAIRELSSRSCLGHERSCLLRARLVESAGQFLRSRWRHSCSLDEVGELPLRPRSKLLRALQGRRGSMRRIAAARQSVDVRILATMRPRREVGEATFREEPFTYRINDLTCGTCRAARNAATNYPGAGRAFLERIHASEGAKVSGRLRMTR